MTIEQAAPQLDSLRQQIYAALDKVPYSEARPVYDKLMATSKIGTHAERVKAMQDIVAALKGKA